MPPQTTRAARTLDLETPPLTGDDVVALQRLLAPYHPGDADGVYGPLTAAAVERAKWALGYPSRRCDGVAEPALVARLEGLPLPRGYEARRVARARAEAEAAGLRAAIVANARWGIENAAAIHYAELRPIDGIGDPRRLPLTTDCSGFVTLCYAWAGVPDPNGLGYDGQGFTGTLLNHLRPIPPDAVQPADVVVFGPPPGHHAALALEAGADPLLCSHGGEDGPLAIAFSVEAARQPAPATWLRLPPAETAELRPTASPGPSSSASRAPGGGSCG